MCSTDVLGALMTSTCRMTVALGVALLVSWPVSGKSADTRVDCRDGGRTQLEINTCAGQEAEAAKKRLAALLAELDTVLTPPARTSLATVQTRWVAFRDLDCKWEQAAFEGGSVAPAVYASCVTSQTEQRIQRLSIFLCEGAGMTGPCEASERYLSSEARRSRTKR